MVSALVHSVDGIPGHGAGWSGLSAPVRTPLAGSPLAGVDFGLVVSLSGAGALGGQGGKQAVKRRADGPEVC